MKKIDLFVICAPNFDSPIIRDFIHKYHTRLNKIFYVISYSDAFFKPEWEVFSEFIEDDLRDKCEIIYANYSGAGDTDWRDECVHKVLERSTGDYIFTFEPDFVANWEQLLYEMENADYKLFASLVYNYSGIRIWPCFWGCKKELLNEIEYKKFAAPVDRRVKDLFKINYNKYIVFENGNDIPLDSNIDEFIRKNKLVVRDSDKPIYYDHFDLVTTQLLERMNDDGNQLLLLNRMNIWYKHYMGITHDFDMMFKYDRKARETTAYKEFFEYSKNNTSVKLLDEWVTISNKIVA